MLILSILIKSSFTFISTIILNVEQLGKKILAAIFFSQIYFYIVMSYIFTSVALFMIMTIFKNKYDKQYFINIHEGGVL